MSGTSQFIYWLNISLLILYIVSITSAITVILRENRNPIRSLAWITALIFLPLVGLIFYLFFGRSLKNVHMISRHKKRKLMRSSSIKAIPLQLTPVPPAQKNIIRLSYSLSRSQFTLNNRVSIFTQGIAKFEALKTDLLNASSFILLQYYIFSDDTIGNQIADILISKARQGIPVKIIYDHVGSFSTKNRFFARMRQNGIDVHPFFKVTFPQLANRINWRNHRKIVIIDGTIGYIGGMNIADRYIYPKNHQQPWRDTHFRLQGDIVESLMLSFAIDWSFMGQPLQTQTLPHAQTPFRNNVGIQLVTGGPTQNWDNLSLCFLKAISSATKSIYIQTPYFLPTDTLLQALESASLAKIDVRIMIPERCDSTLLRLASFSYITQCLKAGIKIYLYKPGMLHAKAIIIDDNLVTAGSANFDFRSLENNFEANIFIYDPEINRQMRDIFFADIQKCQKLTLRQWHSRPIPQRGLESIVRLLAPIL